MIYGVFVEEIRISTHFFGTEKELKIG